MTYACFLPGVLACCGLSGGFHSAIEICGREYQFRGCSNVNEGIFETHPAHSLNQKVEQSGKSEFYHSHFLSKLGDISHLT